MQKGSSSTSNSTQIPMSNEEWIQVSTTFQHVLFRLEAMPEYSSEAEKPLVENYETGKPVPLQGPLADYFDRLGKLIKSGKEVERLHVVPDTLTPYLRWEIFWAYQHMADRGVKVYLLPQSKFPELAAKASEFYLIDDSILVHVCYDSKGAFTELQRETDQAKIVEAKNLRQQLIAAAIPFEEFAIENALINAKKCCKEFPRDGLEPLMSTFQSTGFRLETLDCYTAIPSDDQYYEAFLGGDPLPPPANEPKLRWRGLLKSATELGKDLRRVHIIPPINQLTNYLRYEIEWGYCINSQFGEKIYLLDRAALPEFQKLQGLDFYLFDELSTEPKLLYVNYDKSGRFTGIQLEEDKSTIATFQQLKVKLLEKATPLNEFLKAYRTN